MKKKKGHKGRGLWFVITIVVLLLVACSSVFFVLDVQQAPQCSEPMIMPTGEQWIPIVWDSPLPETVSRGETVPLHFTDSYLLFAMGQTCDGELSVTHPTMSGMRTVYIYLDEALVFEADCPRVCEIEWIVPETLARGVYTLKIGHFGEYEIRVE